MQSESGFSLLKNKTFQSRLLYIVNRKSFYNFVGKLLEITTYTFVYLAGHLHRCHYLEL